MTTKSITLASAGQKDNIARLVQEVCKEVLDEQGLSKEEAQRILRKGGELKAALSGPIRAKIQRYSMAPHIVVVPDMSAVELTALTKRCVRVGDKELPLTYLDPGYENWDFYRGIDGSVISGRGQSFETLVWKPELVANDVISSDAVRIYFRELGFYGHAGAFTEWRRTCGLMGRHASIPEDNDCWQHSDGEFCVPYSSFDGHYRSLDQCWIDDDWDGNWSFVGFCMVS